MYRDDPTIMWPGRERGSVCLRRFFRLLLDKNWQPPVASADDSLAKTAKDALHVRGERGAGGQFTSTGAVYKHIAEGHQNYAKSFKKKRG